MEVLLGTGPNVSRVKFVTDRVGILTCFLHVEVELYNVGLLLLHNIDAWLIIYLYTYTFVKERINLNRIHHNISIYIYIYIYI
jgi:hypothetical protein